VDAFEELEHPHEACGVFGIYAPGYDVANNTFFGLFALQHRGQESAGIAVSDGEQMRSHIQMGLVNQVFTEEIIGELRGHIAIGHTRYSTTGGSALCNAQPIRMHDPLLGDFALAHNGNLANAVALTKKLQRQGITLDSESDSEIIGRLLMMVTGDTWEARLQKVMPQLSAAYSLVILTQHAFYAVRDPYAVRPLVLGHRDENWVVASETCALQIVGAKYVREVNPGEILRIDGVGHDHLVSTQGTPPRKRASCLFEQIYFARPDSIFGAGSLYAARQRMGVALAAEYAPKVDLVIAVPDSATPAATGYAAARTLPYAEGLIKNRYVGRTFIQPDQHLRELGVHLKFNALPDVLGGKKVMMIDDSIVRGTTTRQLVQMIRDAGAEEVHVGVTSPPFRHPCYLGIDVAKEDQLIAARLGTVEAIREHIGADGLHYLSLDGLIGATALPPEQFCTGCLTGRYPVQIEEREPRGETVLA
jgi:amidophosphoribosyltransferase